MKQLYVFILVLLLVSCKYFNVKKTSSDAILKEDLKAFNWEDVDEYPSFSICDSSATKTVRKICFQNVLMNHITSFLQRETIVVTQDINDTIQLKFQINRLGDLLLKEAKTEPLTIQEIPNINCLLRQSLDSLPQIFPANKRGQLVTTEFYLPVIIKVD